MIDEVKAMGAYHPRLQLVVMGLVAALVVMALIGLLMAIGLRRRRMLATGALVMGSLLLIAATWLWFPTNAEIRSIVLRVSNSRPIGRSSDSTGSANSATQWFLSSAATSDSFRSEVTGPKIEWITDFAPISFGDETEIASGRLTAPCGISVMQLSASAVLPPEVRLNGVETAAVEGGKSVVLGLTVVCR